MSKGFQKTTGETVSPSQEDRNVAQIRQLMEMAYQNSMALRHMQNQIDTLVACNSMAEKFDAITYSDFVLLSAKVFDENFENEVEGAAISNHLLDTSKAELYANGFVQSLISQKPGTTVTTTAAFPEDNSIFPGQTKGFKIKILKAYKA